MSLARVGMWKVFSIFVLYIILGSESMFKCLFFDYVCAAGNMVEFCLPHDINLDGVEFKSMASGSHRITNDFMYVSPLD